MLATSDIEVMSVVERLQAIEMLWTSVCRTEAAIESPAWHGKILVGRRFKVDAGEGKFLTLAELRARLNPTQS